MLFVLVISLYTVRVVLLILGANDYGIYNAIGGFVGLFNVLSVCLATASQRYFAYELGKGDIKRLQHFFSTIFNCILILTLIIVLLSGTVGLWFLNCKMTIQPDRMNAARWTFLLSVVTYIFKMLSSPYIAVIIAREKMNIYAYVGIIEVVLQLILVYAITMSPIDKLITYSFFIFLNSVFIFLIYVTYCLKHFPESHYSWFFDRAMFKEVASYSSWNLYGDLGGVVSNHGINLLLNVFFTPVVNASRGISMHMNTVLNQFSSNFYTAVRPQITKYYARNEMKETFNLVNISTKMSYYLVLLFAIPLFLYAKPILLWWLTNVPEYAVIFSKLVVVYAIINQISEPLRTLIQATGQVRIYQLIIGTLAILTLPLSWVLLKLGRPPYSVFVVTIVVACVQWFARVAILKKQVQFPIVPYVNSLIYMMLTTLIAFLLNFLVSMSFQTYPKFGSLLITMLISVLLTSFCIIFIGMNANERHKMISLVKRRFSKTNSYESNS